MVEGLISPLTTAAATTTTTGGQGAGTTSTTAGRPPTTTTAPPPSATVPEPGTPPTTAPAPPTTTLPAPPTTPATRDPCPEREAGTLATAAEEPPVAAVPPVMRADRLDMSGLAFDGVTELQTAEGPLRVLRFSMDRAVISGYQLDVPGGAGLSGSALTLEGSVVFYSTRFSGRLFGLLPLTFTPDFPPPLVLPEMTFTEVTSTQVFVRTQSLELDRLRQESRPSGGV